MTSELFLLWFNDVFLPHTSHLRTDNNVVVLVIDGFGGHTSDAIIEHAREHSVELLKLTPHATDRQQPLDLVSNKSLKAKFHAAKTERQRAGVEWSTAEAVLTLCLPMKKQASPWDQAFAPDRNRTAFAKPGIYPLNDQALAGLGVPEETVGAGSLQGLDLLLLAADDPELLEQQRTVELLAPLLPKPAAPAAARATGQARLMTADEFVMERQEKAAQKQAELDAKAARKAEKQRKKEQEASDKAEREAERARAREAREAEKARKAAEKARRAPKRRAQPLGVGGGPAGPAVPRERPGKRQCKPRAWD